MSAIHFCYRCFFHKEMYFLISLFIKYHAINNGKHVVIKPVAVNGIINVNVTGGSGVVE